MTEEFDIAKQIADVRRGREELDRRKQENSAAFDSLNSRLRQIDQDIKQMRENIVQTRSGDGDEARDSSRTTPSPEPQESLRELKLRQRREDLRDYAQATRDLEQLAQHSRLAQRQKDQDALSNLQNAHEGELKSQLEDQALRTRRQREREGALSQSQQKLNQRDVDQTRREKFLDDRDEVLRKRHTEQNERERLLNERERELADRERRLKDAQGDGNGNGSGAEKERGRDAGRVNKNPRRRC
jgi:hypothetical protein